MIRQTFLVRKYGVDFELAVYKSSNDSIWRSMPIEKLYAQDGIIGTKPYNPS